MTNNSQNVSLSDFLSDVSVAVVVTLQTQDQAAAGELSDRLAKLETEFAGDQPELATYFGVLHGLLQGDDVSQAAEELVGPYRAGYERILQELEGAPKERPATTSTSEWVANVTSVVATTTKHGSDAERAGLEQELAGFARRMPLEETAFHDFIDTLRGILRGEDTRMSALKLQPPYREAYQSLLQLLAAEDSIDATIRAILDRVQHNTVMALTRGDKKLRQAVADALADIEDILTQDDPTAPHLRSLLAGAQALLLNRKPPASVEKLPDPFAETWQSIVEATQE